MMRHFGSEIKRLSNRESSKQLTRKWLFVEQDVDEMRPALGRNETDQIDALSDQTYVVRYCCSVYHYFQLTLACLRHIDWKRNGLLYSKSSHFWTHDSDDDDDEDGGGDDDNWVLNCLM